MAGHYTKEKVTLFLNGVIQLRLDFLQIGWSNDGNRIDQLRYEIRSQRGKVVLQNIDYVDRAISERELVRWSYSPTPLEQELANRPNRLGQDPRGEAARRCLLDVSPYNLDSGKVRFHLLAAGRRYHVVWRPKTGEVYASW